MYDTPTKTRLVRVKITQPIINEACRSSRNFNPIAWAVRELLRNEDFFVAVDDERVVIKPNDGGFLYSTRIPHQMVNWLKLYDTGYGLSPFEFDLPIPEEYLP